ncbi:DoxX-like family protein [Hansschlegelia sp.]|uniref:DoxX-like family protein n=1 Tax=Hansschlegelia sp. TaxID=2041892 RepID=UPI002B5CF83E|nr:DoxX-like family protein [Hansschlegelia sp.]HVI27298.1 DoxX-like family protein [Hansschlegelia sp.]
MIGIGIAFRRTARMALYAAIAISLFYAAAGTAILPELWLDPLGPMFKIWPILALNLVALALPPPRRNGAGAPYPLGRSEVLADASNPRRKAPAAPPERPDGPSCLPQASFAPVRSWIERPDAQSCRDDEAAAGARPLRRVRVAQRRPG